MSSLCFVDRTSFLPHPNSDVTVVTFSADIAAACPDTLRSVRATDYIDDSRELISATDYELMRSWLADHCEYDGIDLGPLLQSQFVYLFGTQFFRQFRTVRAVIEVEQPDRVEVRTTPRLQYDWLETGSSDLYPPIFECLQEEYDFDLSVIESGLKKRLKSTFFKTVGVRALRTVERATETYTRFQDDPIAAGSEVLFFVSNINNLSVLIPVWKELDDRGVGVTVVYHVFGVTNYDVSALDSLRETGVRVQAFESYMPRSAYRRTRREQARFEERWDAVVDDPTFQRRFELDGVPVWGALKERFALHYRFHYQRLVRYIETSRRVLEAERPNAVAFKGVGPKSARTFATVCKDEDIPTLMIQHGRSNPIQRFEPLVDHVASWGELSKEFLETRGYDPEQVTVCGSPKFDHLHDLNVDRVSFRSELGIDADADVLMLASQPYGDEIRRSIVTALCKSLEPLDDVVLLLRPHPREDGTLLRDVADQFDVQTAYAPEEDIHGLISVSDAVAGVLTTVLFETSLLETPAIILDFTEEPVEEFWRREGFTVVDDTADLPSVVAKILQDESYRADVISSQASLGRRYAHNEDGGAAERIADLLQGL